MFENKEHHDRGTFDFSNSYFHFVGETVGGQPHGYGVLYFGDGGSLEGDFEHGELNGQGTRRWASGAFYSGMMHRGEPDGIGRYVGVDGTVYEGAFAEGLRHGQGQLDDRQKLWRYKGEFVKHKFHGQGELQLHLQGSSQTIIKGNFSCGKMHGHVDCSFANGDLYNGNTVEGEFEGECLFISRGISYRGEMHHNRRVDVPTKMILTDVVLLKQSVLVQMAMGDNFITCGQFVPLMCTVTLAQQRTIADNVPNPVTTKTVAKGSKKSPVPAMIEVKKEVTEKITTESGRRVVAQAFPLEPGTTTFNRGSPVSLADQSVTGAEVAQLLRRRSPSATPIAAPLSLPPKPVPKAPVAPTKGKKPVPLPKPDPRQAAKEKEKEKDDPAASSRLLLLSTVAQSPKQTAEFENGVAAISVNLLDPDPGDYAIVLSFDSEQKVALTPGEASSVVAMPVFEIVILVHIVRQC